MLVEYQGLYRQMPIKFKDLEEKNFYSFQGLLAYEIIDLHFQLHKFYTQKIKKNSIRSIKLVCLQGFHLEEGGGDFPLLLMHVSPATLDKFV